MDRGDRPCGLLADRLFPTEASARLAERYPFASIAEMRGTCGLDASCEMHAREMVWLKSHNRNVAGAAHERRLAEDANRRGRVGVAETIIGGVVLSGGVLAVALGANIR